jgi:multiple sugar transport system permease protein
MTINLGPVERVFTRARLPISDTHARKGMSQRDWRQAKTFYLFISPWLLGFIFLSVVPLLVGLLISFSNYDGLNAADVKLVGLRNYARAFEDSETQYALGRTALWTLLNVPLWLGLSFGLAMLMNQRVRGRGFFRTIFYLPSAVPVVATVWIWRIFLDKNYGLVNGLLSLIRPGTAFPWLTDYALESLTAISLWTGLGTGMVIFLAGLQDIPTELEEAARIDGANSWQVWRHVTLPLMTPVLFFQLVLALISSLQTFVIPTLLAKAVSSGAELSSLPPRGVYLYVIHTFQQIFVFRRFGYGIAMLWLLFILIIVLTFIVFRTQRYWVYYETAIEEKKT